MCTGIFKIFLPENQDNSQGLSAETLPFLNRILPPDGEGKRCIQIERPDKTVIDRFFATNGEAAQYATKHMLERLVRRVSVHVATGTGENRKSASVTHVKAFCVDLDCGRDKPYASPSEALA